MAEPAIESLRTLYRAECTDVEPQVDVVDAETATALLARGRHFETPSEAWEWLRRDVDAQRSLVAGEIARLRAQLRRAETEAADAVVREREIRERRERWEKKGEST